MHNYFFQLGTTSKLSFAELISVLDEQSLEKITDQIISLETNDALDVQELQSRLGGCVKILQGLTILPAVTPRSIAEAIATHVAEGRINFAFGEFNRSNEEAIDAGEIKKELVLLGRSTRFVDSHRSGISAAVLLHQHKVQEFIVITTKSCSHLAHTVAVQNIDDWTVRDRRKPYADRKKGMLPPKVARVLLNINRSFDKSEKRVVLDPFCGSGNILLENAVLNDEGVGIDLDKNSVSGTIDNLKWFSETYQRPHNQQVHLGDATHVPELVSHIVTAIVTEPFLGRPKPKPEHVPDIFRGLEKLYLGAFKNWKTFLPSGAPVTIVFPHTTVKDYEFNMDHLIDKLLPLGYTTVSGPLKYSRPDAIVSRSIYTFILKK